MPISKEESDMAEATVNAIRANVSKIERPVRVTPERMDAFHKATRMRMTLNIDGKAVMMVEDAQAPVDLMAAIREASKDETKVGELGKPCGQCGAATVLLEGGEYICVRCKSVSGEPTTDEKPSIVLASERASMEREAKRVERRELTKHPSRRKGN
jgi:hypothetical protein